MTKQARQFNDILDECLDKLLTNSQTIEECLSDYPEHANELEPLLRTVLETRQALSFEPPSEVRERCRHHFRIALRQMEAANGRRLPFFGWKPGWAITIIVIVALLLSGTGTMVAASKSLPDETLYPVKMAAETVRVALTPSAMSKADLHTRLADRRMAEILSMVETGKPEQVEKTAERLNLHLATIVDLARPPDVDPDEETGMLMAPELSPKAAPPVQRDNSRGIEIDKVTDDGRAQLRAIVARQAVEHRKDLEESLKNAPESVKPVLHRIIAASGSAYQTVLKALE